MENASHKHAGLTLANKLTIVRILGVPVFILVVIYYLLSLRAGEGSDTLKAGALLLFTTLALTDALDGYLARSRNEITTLGRLLDPLADKALLLSAIILLTHPTIPELSPHIPVWFTLLVISRDVVLVLGAMLIHALAGHVDVKPHIVGKVATFFQMVTVFWVLIGAAPRPFFVCVLFAGLFTFLSGAIYLVDGIRQLERAAAAHKLHTPVIHG